MESDLSKQTSAYYTDAVSSSAYRTENSSFQTQGTTDTYSEPANTDQSKYAFTQSTSQNKKKGKESIKLVPLKTKDLKKMLQNIPEYNGKKPVTINIKENDIDEVIEQRRYNSGMSSGSELISLGKSIQASPISLRHLEEYVKQKESYEKDATSRYSKYSTDEPSSKFKRRSFEEEKRSIPSEFKRRSFDEAKRSIPPLGAGQTPQVYAMTDIQAYPMVGGGGRGGGFNVQKSKTPKRKIQKRPKSRKLSPSKPTLFRKRSNSPPVKSRGRPKRGRTPQRKPPARVPSPKRRRSSLVIRKRRPSPVFYSGCAAYPMCDTGMCDINRSLLARGESHIRRPSRSSRTLIGEDEYLQGRHSRPIRQGHSSSFMKKGHSKPIIRQGISRGQMSLGSNCNTRCDCCFCQEKLQFIQPGVCSKRKDNWTNEYAIIPKPQINLIDPCQELDPTIYPRADRPCIRDGRGNPLTDCIGRPLRDPVGKKFLRFSANGSVMDTNFNGNFYSGQPPLCVKCTLPGASCAPDTTHNWWMGCGYPIMPNMSPFFNSVVATENCQKRCTK